MSHLETPKMKKMYPNGYPRENRLKTCGTKRPLTMGTGGTCIIDNDHPGRAHWGPDADGVYHEWTDSIENYFSIPENNPIVIRR